jgi:hypothetical protein
VVNTLLFALLSTVSAVQDPTRPLTPAPLADTAPAVVALGGQPRLQAIFSGGRPSAIVDGRLYFQGDAIGPFTLARIERQRIVLQGPGETLELALFPLSDHSGSQ